VPDKLRNEYLLFSADVDGELDPFLDSLCESIPREIDAVYGHCVGYPGVADGEAFRGYMHHNQIDTTFPFAASAEATVSEVREGLELRRRLIEFAVQAQHLDPAGVQEAYRRAFAAR
jgi:hypothetical protein